MIKNNHYYPDWIWKKKLHKNEETGTYEGDCSLCVLEGNRFGGKSVGVGVYAIKDFFDYGYRCCYVTRYKDDMEDKKILPLESFWNKSWRYVNSDEVRVPDIENHTITFKGHYAYIDDKLFCYPASLSVSGKTKNADFDNVHTIIFDEYISEDNRELPDEITCIYRLYDTVARGREDALQTTSMIFISNCITKASTLKEELGISKLAREDTKRLDRGKDFGWCYERILNKAVADAYSESAIAKAMRCGGFGKAYLGYAQNNEFKDNEDFVQVKPPKGNYLYKCTLTFNNKSYAIRYYGQENKFYMTDEEVKDNYPLNFAMTREDHTINTNLILNKTVKDTLNQYKLHFGYGNMLFNNLKTKSVFMDIYKYL